MKRKIEQKSIGRFLLYLIPVWVFFHFSLSFAENEIYYRIKVPIAALSCAQEAEQLGARYRQLSHLAAISSVCSGVSTIENENSSYRFYILDLTYKLPPKKNHQQIYSSYYGYSIFGSDQRNLHGMYLSMSECLSELKMRTKEFEANSKKTILASTCERSASDYKTTFVARMDTVGKPAIQLGAKEDFLDRYSESPFTEAVEKIIRANHGTIVAHKEGYYYFYSDKTIEPQSHQFGRMRLADCQDQIVDVQAILKDYNKNEITLGCTNRFRGVNGLTHLEVILNGFTMFYEFTESEAYPNFDECQSDKARVLRQKRDSGQKVIAALCRYSDFVRDEHQATYRMDVYEGGL